MKIYTKTGDDGLTGLFGGDRVAKTHLRVEAYGCTDELSSALGLARASGATGDLDECLARIQNEIFHLGSELATAAGHESKLPPAARLGDGAERWLEETIDAWETELSPLRTFVLPGGTPLAAQLHVARTLCRRAERALVALAAAEPVAGRLLVYLNRLSDLLFTAARVVNRRAGVEETRWSVR